MTPARGEIWLFDLGMAAKVRPALIVSVAYGDLDRALVTILPHTTSLRGSQYEVAVDVAFLKRRAFLVQNVATYPNVRAIRKLGVLTKDQFDVVFAGLLRWLGHTAAPPQSHPGPE
jgi:mRNA interferase MazF